LSRVLIICVATIGATAYVYTPWPAAAAVQNSVLRKRFDARLLHVRFEPGAKRFFPLGMMWRGDFQVDVPLAIGNIPEALEVIPDGISLMFAAADGTAWKSGPYRYPPVLKESPGPGPIVLNANVDVPVDFFERAKRQRVTLTGSLYLTVFGNWRAITIPIGTVPVNISDGLQCGMTAFKQLSCRSPFRWPNGLVYASFADYGRLPFTRSISYSPLPSGLDLFSIESNEVSVPPGRSQVTIMTADRLTSSRVDFEIHDFPLVTFASRVPGGRRRD
jgi:hypothetical protein